MTDGRGGSTVRDMSKQLDEGYVGELAGWLMQTVGKAITFAWFVGFIAAALAVITSDTGVLWLAALFCPLVFALTIYGSKPPKPLRLADPADTYQIARTR